MREIGMATQPLILDARELLPPVARWVRQERQQSRLRDLREVPAFSPR